MGKRDYRRREPKKSKKDARKVSVDTILTSPAAVEVVKKGKKRQEVEEE